MYFLLAKGRVDKFYISNCHIHTLFAGVKKERCDLLLETNQETTPAERTVYITQ